MPAKFRVLAFAAVLVPLSVVYCGGFSASVLTLERAFPANNGGDLELLRARDRARHARILQGVVGGVVDFPLVGNSDQGFIGLYLTKVKLGSPPREFTVQIDTGSDILWVACNSCNNCPQSSGLGIELNSFDAASSSTASLVSCAHPVCASEFQTAAAECFPQSNQCGYTVQYGDGSGTNGYFIADLLYFDAILSSSIVTNSSASIVFGCSINQSGDLAKTERAIDGIFGFGQNALSVTSQLSSHGITPKVFSHCLIGEGNGGGKLVLGEILDPNIVYSPLVPSQSHYNLYLQSIDVNGQLLPIDSAVFATSSNRGTIVDSGTTLAYLVEDAYDPLVSAVTATVSEYVTPIISRGSQCYLVSTNITEIFPAVALNFAGGASLVLKPEGYLVHFDDADHAAMWCIGFQKVQDQGLSILGDLVLKDKIFVYDLAHQRIGWADYDCSLPVNVSITYSKDDFFHTGDLSMSSSSRTRIFEPIATTSSTLPLQTSVFVLFLVLTLF